MMKKTILGFSFLLMAAFAGTASAQNCANAENCDKEKSCKTEQCDKKDCKKSDYKDCKKSDCKKEDCKKQKCEAGEAAVCGKKRGCMMEQMFEGITLSDDQKAKIENLQKATMESRKELLKDEAQDKAVAREKMKEANKEIRSKFLKDLSTILTPDQYSTFLQNFFINNPGQQRPSMKAKMGRVERKLDGEIMKAERIVEKDIKKIDKDTKNVEKRVVRDVKKK